MTGQQLKNSILQEAIEGRLVPQDPNDEPASVLLERIRSEKARLVKEKKIKKDKNESRIYRTEDGHWIEHFEDKSREDVCIDEEVPFDVPTGWEWCRLKDCISYQNGYAYKPIEVNKEKRGLPVIKSGNLMTYEVVVKPNNDYVEAPTSKMLASVINEGDLLMCLSSQSDNPEPLGKTAIYKAKTPALLNQRVLKMRPYLSFILEYLYLAINSEYFHYKVSHQGGGSAQANLKLEHVLNMLIPMPPINEQHRIVEKTELLLSKIKAYSKAQVELEKLNEALPEQLKKSILQEAIEGRLVPQDPNDEPASVLLERIRAEKARLVKEKKIKKSRTTSNTELQNTEQLNFDIPGNWCWTTLGEICIFLSRGKSPKYSETDKTYPVFAQKCNLKDGGISLEQARFLDPSSISKWDDIYKLRTGDVLINSTGTGTVCRTRLFDEKYLGIYPFVVPDSHVSVVRTSEYIYSEFVLAYISSKTIQQFLEDNLAGSTNQKELYIGVLEKLPIPLPPLTEQHRIVEKIESLLPKIENLKVKK